MTIETRTPAEYRPLLAVEMRTDAAARIGYTFAALRRELDWHETVARTAPERPDRWAASCAVLEIRHAVDRFLAFGIVETVLADLATTLAATKIDTGDFEYDVDPDQLAYRADAAARIRLIARSVPTF